MQTMRVSSWATGSSRLVRGRSVVDGLPRVESGELRFEDGTTAEVGEDLLELLRVLLEGGLAGCRARVEVTPELVTPEEAAKLLGVTRPTVYAWQKAGVLGQIAHGNRRMVPVADVDAVRAAAVQRVQSDRLIAESDPAARVLSDAEYHAALRAALAAGGERAAAQVRRTQKAAIAHRAAADAVASAGDAG